METEVGYSLLKNATNSMKYKEFFYSFLIHRLPYHSRLLHPLVGAACIIVIFDISHQSFLFLHYHLLHQPFLHHSLLHHHLLHHLTISIFLLFLPFVFIFFPVPFFIMRFFISHFIDAPSSSSSSSTHSSFSYLSSSSPPSNYLHLLFLLHPCTVVHLLLPPT